jgi:hypothetical protein
LATTAIPTDLVDLIAAEMSVGIERAVDCWMSQLDEVLSDVHLTTLGRLNAIRSIVDEYKYSTGKLQLSSRRVC